MRKWRYGGMIPHILDLSTRWGWVVASHPRLTDRGYIHILTLKLLYLWTFGSICFPNTSSFICEAKSRPVEREWARKCSYFLFACGTITQYSLLKTLLFEVTGSILGTGGWNQVGGEVYKFCLSMVLSLLGETYKNRRRINSYLRAYSFSERTTPVSLHCLLPSTSNFRFSIFSEISLVAFRKSLVGFSENAFLFPVGSI
jgi:hypothetical protein